MDFDLPKLRPSYEKNGHGWQFPRWVPSMQWMRILIPNSIRFTQQNVRTKERIIKKIVGNYEKHEIK